LRHKELLYIKIIRSATISYATLPNTISYIFTFMAQSFSIKKYLSKLQSHELLSELIANHGAQALFEINDQTPRKLAVQLMDKHDSR
jgi:hypothetical protein